MDEYQLRIQDQILYVHPPTELAFAIVPRLKTEVEKALEQPSFRAVVVDLSQTTFVDSTGIGMLILLQKMAAQFDIPVHLSRPRPEVRKILHLVGLYAYFHIQEED